MKRTTQYFAGLIDGEGHISLEKRSQYSFRPVIQVNMTCFNTIKAIHKHFKVGTVTPRKVPSGNKPQWRWRTTYKGARMVAKKLLPYSLTKKAELLKLIGAL